MKNPEKYHKPFTLAWFLHRTSVVIRERRLPDMTLIKKQVSSLFQKSKAGKMPGYLRLPAELLEPASCRHAKPLIITRDKTGEQKFINSYFDQVYVTSPHSRHDTRLAMIRRLKHLGIVARIIETDDSGKIAGNELKGLSIVLNDAMNNHFGRILHLKDTVLFAKDFHARLREALANIPGDWHLLFLGSSDENLADNLRLTGTFAVGIDSSIFRSLKKSIDKSLSEKIAHPNVFSGISTEKCIVLPPVLAVDSETVGSKGNGSAEPSLRQSLIDFDEGPVPALVSVIMPAYNAEKTIEKSIRSILRQSYRNLELIVADDCSKDNTRNIVKELAKGDSRVHLVERTVNQGCYFARNDALRAASGKYIAVQDADDISLEKRIAKQLIPIVSGDAMFTLAWILRSRLKIAELDMENERAMIQKVLDNRALKPDKSYGYWDRPILGFMTSVFERSLFEGLGLFWEYRFGADAEYFERIIFSKTGRILKPGEPNVHSLLLSTDSIPGIYRRVEQILLISAEMTEHNITRSYHTEQLKNFIANYRARYTGDYDYQYPEF
jgi:glycosyltransferase involved in cell wall biosynthesis